MTARTMTVETGDHGPVRLPVPSWVTWTTPAVDYRSDICHNGAEYPLIVVTPCCGEVRVATAQLTQWPYSVDDTEVRAAVELDNNHEFDSESLAGFLDALVVWAVGPMHALHEQLQRLEGGDAP
ncbi:DUF6907 domain-containing protein [Streptomyces sp. AN091965]|uniref:DUF6907 domain-containing protein n=1 Tax=Streptomyces sp. AN091965 TaxID=2927803 RepID=UPI001F6045D7|nr:hypothetical protein [Streptomyces sp. AN091965]MCI3930200.1 hypothetical protein [Streptomyces sp. AN091965]